MGGISRTGAGHALANFEAFHVLPKCNDRSGRGIAGRHRLVEAVENGAGCIGQTFAARFVDYLPDKVRTGTRLVNNLFGHHALCACGNQAGRHFDKCLAGLRGWDGNIFDSGFPRFDVLEELFHDRKV